MQQCYGRFNAVLDQRLWDERTAADADAAGRSMTCEQWRAEREAEAINELERGNPRPMADLLEQHHRLGPKAAVLAAARLRGELKAKPGRPPGSKHSVTHWAACDLPAIMAVLREHYPSLSATRTVAIKYAALRWDIDDDKLINRLKSRHRPR
jgi:hypothetical protein